VHGRRKPVPPWARQPEPRPVVAHGRLAHPLADNAAHKPVDESQVQDQVSHSPLRARRHRRSGPRTHRLAPGNLECSDLLAEMPDIVHRDPFVHLGPASLRPALGASASALSP